MVWIVIAINALVAFAATFSGVYLSFRKERKRAEAQEKEQFGGRYTPYSSSAPEQKRGVLERGTAKLYLLRIEQNSYSV